MAAALAEGRVPRRRCAECTEAQKRDYGCTADTENQAHWLTTEDGEAIRRCPMSMAGARELRVIQYAGLIESGVLPDAGGWLDQAASYTDAVPIALCARRDFARAKENDRR